MVAAIPIGDRDDRCLGSCLLCWCSWLFCSRCGTSILATYRERRRVHMDLIGLHPEDLSCLARNASKQLGGIMGVQPIQRASQAIIIEHLCFDACSQQVLDWFVPRVLRHYVS